MHHVELEGGGRLWLFTLMTRRGAKRGLGLKQAFFPPPPCSFHPNFIRPLTRLRSSSLFNPVFVFKLTVKHRTPASHYCTVNQNHSNTIGGRERKRLILRPQYIENRSVKTLMQFYKQINLFHNKRMCVWLYCNIS